MELQRRPVDKNRNVLYYPWNDGVDYDHLCHILLHHLKSPANKYTTVNMGAHGGIGHKFEVILTSLPYALLLQRNYYMSMSSVYWNNIDSCLNELRFEGNLSPFKLCDKSNACHMPSLSYKSLIKENIRLDDYRIATGNREKRDIVVYLRKIGFLKGNEGYEDYVRYLLRILYNPSRPLLNEILAERKRIGPPEYQIGAHIRCGGGLSDMTEITAMVTMEKLKEVPAQLRTLISRSSIPKDRLYVYLSTDSTYAARYLTKALSPVSVRMTNLYNRGHTTTMYVVDSALKRSIAELFLVGQSQSLLLTSDSSFSACVSFMSHPSLTMVIQAPYVHTNFEFGGISPYLNVTV